MIATLDVLVVGSDEASLCAAACAARGGARVGLLRSKPEGKRQSGASVSAVPNAVWRRLDLQDYGVSLEPVSARISLMEEGESVATYASVRQTGAALAANGAKDHLLWSSFVDDMARLHRTADLNDAVTGSPNGVEPLTGLLENPRRLAAVGQLTGTCADLLDDFFSDDRLKAHLAACSVGRAGLGGRELGAALEVPQSLDDDAWRVRSTADGASLHAVLEKICTDSGVEYFEGALVSISAEGGKHKTIDITGGVKLKSRCVFFATPEAAASAGIETPASPLTAQNKVTASMRFKLRKSVKPPAGDKDAIFFILDNIDDLQTARDCVVDGQLPESLPVEFEFARNGDLIARTHYCPKAFREEGEWRDWTGQDRQAVAARITQRLASRMSALPAAIKKSKIEFIGADESGRNTPTLASPGLVVIQPSHHNTIGAAVQLLDRVLAHG